MASDRGKRRPGDAAARRRGDAPQSVTLPASGRRRVWASFACRSALLFPVAFFLGSGCVWDRWHLFGSGEAPPPPADSRVLRGDRLEPELPPTQGTAAGDLAGAHDLYRLGEYAKAQKIYHRLAENKKNTEAIAEEARYYEAECLRVQGHWPRAADTYSKLLTDFPSGAHREQAMKRMFDIADAWLDDTREQMRLEQEKRQGKRSFVWPGAFVHFEKNKPLLDEEGRAVEKLEQVVYNDITGPLADQALYLAGIVKFRHQDWREADRYFSQLVEMHPDSKLAPKALEYAIIAKHLSSGGPDYDGTKVAEARQMVYAAEQSYPELAAQKSDFLAREMRGITQQDAEKDLKIADFYRRTGHPAAAYFSYEIVRRRYPGTPFFDKATQAMRELGAKLAKQNGQPAPSPAPPARPENGAGLQPLQPASEPRLKEIGPAPQSLPPLAPAPSDAKGQAR